MLTATAILVVIILSSFFSSTEAAFFSITQAKVNSLAEKSKAGKLLYAMSQKQDEFISTIVCGNNIVNIVGTMIVTLIATEEFGSAWLGAISAIFTFVVIIFAEVIPKNLGEQFNEPLLMKTVFLIKFLMILLKPAVIVVNLVNTGVKSLINKYFGDNGEKVVDEEEVVETVKMSMDDGVIHKDFFDKFKKLLTLDDIKTSEIMTPVEDINFVASDQLISRLDYNFKHSQHSRILVTEGECIDNIKGYVLQKTMVQLLADDQDDLIDRYLVDITFVNENMLLVDLIETLMKEVNYNSKAIRYIAVVQNDKGNTVGVVTLEDVMEEIFGEITDETDS